ncbi:protein DMP2 [Amaranthus tricolor]|uniref:protein DMP2 n=1 Tax=Amaranthus tricolor TaxID=29722 RepID=UPI0025893BDA|nr:protein DMP2 [Amaranthus tricolor]
MGKISVKQQAFNSLGSLIKLLPTGTVFLFQFLSPILSNNGQCHTSNKYLMSVLLVICGFNCCFATFTDSYVDEDGNTHYGIATNKGLWPDNKKGSSKTDLSKYRLRIGDFVHAFMSLLVFGVVAVLDTNTVDCYAPAWESSRKTMLMVLPPVVGGLCSGVFAMFPSTRHGIGYPYDNDFTS